MTEFKPSVETFIEEFQATLAQTGSEPVLRRINAERLLRLVAEELDESLPAARVRFLPDRRMAGSAGADFLFQVDDYDVRLQLLDAPEGRPTLQYEQLATYQDVLEDNPNTVALILVWTDDDLPAVPVSVARLRYLKEHPERLQALLRQAAPVENVLRDIVQKQIKSWDVALEPPPRKAEETADLRETFASALQSILDAELSRSYRTEARKAAARHFPLRAERRLMLRAFEAALTGADAAELARQLSRVSGRDDR